MIIKTVIVEDEKKSLSVLNNLIKNYTVDLEICGSAGHIPRAVQLIETTHPHLVLMDVRIADGTSFEILQNLSYRQFELIFITAFDNYAVDAFKVSAIDYLLKPVGIPEFQEAIERARTKLSEKSRYNNIDTLLQKMNESKEQEKKITIATLNGFEFLDLSEILWCKSDGHYTTFHLVKKSKLVSSRNLGHYEDLLHMNHFCRINHGIMINMQFLKSYMKGKGGYVVMQDGTELEISQRRKADFLSKLSI